MQNNLIKLPGLIDVHVHLREPGGEQKENFETGTRAAVAGGYTQILDMPNNNPPTVTPSSLNEKIEKSKDRIWCDLGFNFGGTVSSTKYFSRIYKKSFGLKVYMNQTTGPLLVGNLNDRDLVFKLWSSQLPVMVHAEGETIKVAIKLAKKYKRSLHICHVAFNQLQIITDAKKSGLKITCEICPHHLFLNEDDINKLGPLGIMKPPLLSKSDQKKLWENLDKIDMISTDHAPHTLSEKFDHSSPKFGVPGLETVIPLFFNSIYKKRITLNKFIQMTSEMPRKIFKLPIQPNTYILVDKSMSFKISEENLFTKCHWTPFKGINGRGKVLKVVLRGKTIFENSQFVGKPQGNVISPNL